MSETDPHATQIVPPSFNKPHGQPQPGQGQQQGGFPQQQGYQQGGFPQQQGHQQGGYPQPGYQQGGYPAPYGQGGNGWFAVQTSHGPVQAPLSTPGKRLGAALLDGVLMLFTLYIGWIIWALIVWSKGQTPAKQILKMKVVDSHTHEPAGWGKMFLREFVIRGIVIQIIGLITLGIGTIVAACMIFNREKNHTTGWDRMSSTVVVDADQLPVA